MRELHIQVVQVSPEIHEEDASIGGFYIVALDDALPDGVAAGVALDSFHRRFPVKDLDDFSFSVIDPETRAFLTEDVDYQAYSHPGARVERLIYTPAYADRMTLHLNGKPLITGDSGSIRVIYNNLSGRNLERQEYDSYLESMESMLKTRLRGQTLSLQGARFFGADEQELGRCIIPCEPLAIYPGSDSPAP